jgi:diguanylate cyclase (GGDEF)-like protein
MLEAPLGSLYLLNAQNQVVAASNEQALPQENLLELPVTAEYKAGARAHVQVFAVGNTGMRVVHYLPNYWLAREIAKGCAPGMVAALLLWLALLLLLRTLRLNRELRRLSEHDALTGALNHRACQSCWHSCIRRIGAWHGVFLVMVDLDHFKKVNDSFGHAMGDEVLKVLVRLAHHLLRSEDKVARLGGEEFVLILPGTDLRDAMKAAVRLRLQLERLHWNKLGLPGKVTASMGCAVVLASDRHAGAVLKRADDAMYRAKQEGRNRVCLDLHGQPPGVQ